jgi:hypothetical protein
MCFYQYPSATLTAMTQMSDRRCPHPVGLLDSTAANEIIGSQHFRKVDMRSSCLFATLLAVAFVATPTVQAGTNTWSFSGSSCVPGDPAIQQDLYVSSGSVSYKGTATGLVTLYCPVTVPTPGATNQLTMTYKLIGSTSFIHVQLLSLDRNSGALSGISPQGVAVAGQSELVVPFGPVSTYLNGYFYVRVDLDRTNSSDQLTFFGVGLDQTP